MSTASSSMDSLDIQKHPYGYLYFLKGKHDRTGYCECECEIRFHFPWKNVDLHVQLSRIRRPLRSYILNVVTVDGPDTFLIMSGHVVYIDEYLTPGDQSLLAHCGSLPPELADMLARVIHTVIHRTILSAGIYMDPKTSEPLKSWYIGFTEEEFRAIQMQSRVLIQQLVDQMPVPVALDLE